MPSKDVTLPHALPAFRRLAGGGGPDASGREDFARSIAGRQPQRSRRHTILRSSVRLRETAASAPGATQCFKPCRRAVLPQHCLPRRSSCKGRALEHPQYRVYIRVQLANRYHGIDVNQGGSQQNRRAAPVYKSGTCHVTLSTTGQECRERMPNFHRRRDTARASLMPRHAP